METAKFVAKYLQKVREKIVDEMNSCTDKSGCMKNEHKYRHAIMEQKLYAFDTVIDFINRV